MNDNIREQISTYFACWQEWNASYEEYAKSAGMSFTALSILSTIYGMEQCTQKKLCEYCFLPKQTVNSVITAFYKKGWIRLEEMAEDRRNKTIHFTDEGLAYAQKVLSPIREAEQRAMETLSAEQREMLLSVTQKYVRSCEEEIRRLK